MGDGSGSEKDVVLEATPNERKPEKGGSISKESSATSETSFARKSARSQSRLRQLGVVGKEVSAVSAEDGVCGLPNLSDESTVQKTSRLESDEMVDSTADVAPANKWVVQGTPYDDDSSG